MKLPEKFIASLEHVKGFDKEKFIAVHESGSQEVSVRLNNAKKAFPGSNQHLNIDSPVPWSSTGVYLKFRPSFTADPLFHAGAYYVQEASSMFLEEIIKQTCDLVQPLKVLDLCAAPGGKSTLIQSLISKESILVSNEVIKARVNILSENITKWGASNVVVTNNDPKDFQRIPAFFDLIVVDAPCSGSGLFRKDPEAITEWSIDNVMLCSQRQQRILSDVLPALKPGGVIIYSTCSYSIEEDEAILSWLTDSFSLSSLKIDISEYPNLVETDTAGGRYGYRFYPDKLRGEGFFIAAFKKPDTHVHQTEIKVKNNPVAVSKAEYSLLAPLIKNDISLDFFKWQDQIIGINAGLLKDVFILQSALYLKKAGVKIGSFIRGELIPDHEMALSVFPSENVPYINVDLETALQYLRRSDINISTSAIGWVLIRYNQFALGWAKVLANRINNYYPREWRILNK